jgi:hypothetical protein
VQAGIAVGIYVPIASTKLEKKLHSIHEAIAAAVMEGGLQIGTAFMVEP